MALDPELILDPELFDQLDRQEQAAYLNLLAAEQDDETHILEPKQRLAEEMAGTVDELLYGGAAGGGKSRWLLMHLHNQCLEMPGHQGLYLRATYPALEMTSIRTSIIEFAKTPQSQRPVWRASRKCWEYPNGSILQFGHLEAFDDVFRYLSTEWATIAIDELTEIMFDSYDLLITRARVTEEKKALGIRPHIVAASNPGQRGHGWVKKRFPLKVEGEYGPRGEVGGVEVVKRRFKSPTTGEWQDVEAHVRQIAIVMPDDTVEYKSVGFIAATVLDNPHLSKDYIRTLSGQSEVRKQQYLYGNWDIFEGQFFDEFRRNKHVEGEGLVAWHVVEPFEIPPGWYRAHGVDYGYAAPFVCLWGAWDPDGRLHIYREVYETGMTPTAQSDLVRKLSVCRFDGIPQKEKTKGFGDPSMWSNTQGGMTVAQQWSAKRRGGPGWPLAKANNDRVGGWARFREYLQPMPAVIDGRETVRPGVVFHACCRNTIRSLPDLSYDKTDPEDLDTTQDDHCADAARYLMMHRPRRIRPVQQLRDGLEGRIDRQIEKMSRKRRGPDGPPELGKAV